MGRRSEQRIAISIPVFVRGMDSHGSPFAAATETYEVSPSGAWIKGLGGLDGILQPRMKVDIQCRDEKARFSVEWVTKNEASKVGGFGVRCLEPGKYIWGVPPKEWKPDSYDASAPATIVSSYMDSPRSASNAWAGDDRRRFSRQSCMLDAQLVSENSSVGVPVRITDLSLSGCYIETMTPLPLDSAVNIAISKDRKTVYVSGKVRFSSRGLGMGIMFTAIRPEDFDNIREFAEPAPRPKMGASPRLEILHYAAENELPSDRAPETADALEAVVRVLFRKGLLTRAELTEEIEKLKFAKV